MSNNKIVENQTSKQPKYIKNNSEVYKRHLVLHEKYKNDPTLAWIIDSSEVIGTNLHDPFRTSVSVNEEMKIPFKIGVHEAVGGDHDFPNPGDLLCASLAACLETTIRMVSNQLNIELTETRIKVTAEVDVRGTLMIDKSVPVNFQTIHAEIVLIANNLNEKILDTLIRASKRSCIIYQTIKKGIPITTHVSFEISN